MDNLHRELAPISERAWAQIEQEASRTLKRHLGFRHVVDVVGPKGADYAAVGTGHMHDVESPGEGVQATQREAKALVELHAPFELSREAVDSVDRGANDPDLQPLKDAARRIASAEDTAIFEGYAGAGIDGIRNSTSNEPLSIPAALDAWPAAVAEAVSRLRLTGVNDPYRLVLGGKAYTAISGAADDGYPVLRRIRHLVDGEIVWAPAIEGGAVLTGRGGDFELHVGRDLSIGYSSNTDTAVQLYFVETFTFIQLTSEAAVVLSPASERR